MKDAIWIYAAFFGGGILMSPLAVALLQGVIRWAIDLLSYLQEGINLNPSPPKS